MANIDGNQFLHIQIESTTKNSIGEDVSDWQTVQSIWGFLDLQSGDSKHTTYNAKMQESTHIFMADYVPLAEGVKAENARAVDEDGLVYDVMLFDDPMKLHEHWEIYLKFTGGQ